MMPVYMIVSLCKLEKRDRVGQLLPAVPLDNKIATQHCRVIDSNGLGTKVGLSMARPTRVCRPS